MSAVETDPLAPEHCLRSTWFIDSDHPSVREFADRVVAEAGATTDRERAVGLFLAVRDGWRYDPYNTSHDREAFKASTVLTTDRNWCIPKSVLLVAACRAVGIPARLGFADVRNHLQSEKLRESMGTDLFVFHGYAEMWIDGAWRKASSAFNQELCDRFGTKVLDFDGHQDALMHPFDESGNRHMEYVNERGSFADMPLDEMLATFAEVYGNGLADSDAAATDDAFR